MSPVPFEIPADATGKDEAAAHVAAVTIIDLLKMEVQRQWEYLALRIKLPTVELMPDVIEQLRDL